jgi:hypothetical protein
LADFFVDAHFAQCGFDPLRSGGREVVGRLTGGGGFFLGGGCFRGGRAALRSRGVSHKKNDCGGYYEQNANASFPQM